MVFSVSILFLKEPRSDVSAHIMPRDGFLFYRIFIHLHPTVFFALKGYFWPWFFGSNLGLIRNNLRNVMVFKFLFEIWWVRIGTGKWSCYSSVRTRRWDESLHRLNRGSFLLFKLTRKLSLCRDCFGINKRGANLQMSFVDSTPLFLYKV